MWPRCLAVVLALGAVSLAASDRPNVVVIMTDDQGVGDFGVMGNPLIRTPHLDAMAVRSARLTNFYVHPVCSPTRACLMTGRYNHRTRVIDTWVGRSMMDPAEVTVAEILGKAGYATGLFGKWHLGDCSPMRPQDQGFEEVLMHRGGGLAQPSEPPENERRYTDPFLLENGRLVQKKGFCTDVYFDAAHDWITRCHEAERPFFAYIATNAPHDPFHDVPEDWLETYRHRDLSNDGFPKTAGHPVPGKANLDRRARIFAMISNIDDNVGRLFAHLSELGILENTLVLFLNDNGPNGDRFTGGFRGRKSEVTEGGIRAVLFAHWPGTLRAGHRSDELTAHIDLLPTILEACQVAPPSDRLLDGRSAWPLLKGEKVAWPDRTLVIQAHRGDRPFLHHNVAVRTREWKLVHPSGFHRETFEGEPRYELYHLAVDPFEMEDVAASHPEVVAKLRAEYVRWFEDVTAGNDFLPPRIHVGSGRENPVVLTRQDWRRDEGESWAGKDALGHWRLEVRADAWYRFSVRRHPDDQAAGQVRLAWRDRHLEAAVEAGETDVLLSPVELASGPIELRAVIRGSEETWGAYQVTVFRVGER